MIDYEALRGALRDECYAACFGGGIGPAIMDALSVEDMSPEEPLRPDEGGQGARGCALREAVRGAEAGGLRASGDGLS